VFVHVYKFITSTVWMGNYELSWVFMYMYMYWLVLFVDHTLHVWQALYQ